MREARRARQAAGAAPARDVSQVSVRTGISRREVARISAALQPLAVQRPAPATQLFLRWVSDKRLRGRNGQPRPLPRTGRAPSFESLARSVTRHVHARSLLDELCRLGLAALSDDGQTVRLIADHYVPDADDARLFAFLGANVGDHLAAAAANVRHRARRHFEQALFTDDLSVESAAELGALVKRLWADLTAVAVPELDRLIAADEARQRPAAVRARIGLFSYHEALAPADTDPEGDRHDPS